MEIRTLTSKHVNILKRDNGNERITFMNSEEGREKLEEQIPSPYKDEILLFWGDEPTFDGNIED